MAEKTRVILARLAGHREMIHNDFIKISFLPKGCNKMGRGCFHFNIYANCHSTLRKTSHEENAAFVEDQGRLF